MPAKVGYLAIDTIDPDGLAPFWWDCSASMWTRRLERVIFSSCPRQRTALPSGSNGCRRGRQGRTGSIWISLSMTWTPQRLRLSNSGADG